MRVNVAQVARDRKPGTVSVAPFARKKGDQHLPSCLLPFRT